MNPIIAKTIFEKVLNESLAQLKTISDRFDSIENIWDLFEDEEGQEVLFKVNEIKTDFAWLKNILFVYLTKMNDKYEKIFQKQQIDIKINQYLSQITQFIELKKDIIKSPIIEFKQEKKD